MVDQKQRGRLSEALSKLVDGQMTNDQFDEQYSAHWAESSDRGVREIAEFGYCLYSSDLPSPYLLQGRYAADAETKRITERCLCFLATDLEYAWPERPCQILDQAFGGLSVFLIIPLAVVLLIAAFIQWIYFVAGLMVLLLGWLLWRASRSTDTPEWHDYWAAGDKDAWPFLHESDLNDSHLMQPV